MYFQQSLAILLSVGALVAAAGVPRAEAGFSKRISNTCGSAECQDANRRGIDKANTACCNQQIKGLFGPGLLFTNDNLKIGFGDEDQDICITKTDEGKQINGPQYESCCKAHGGTRVFCI